MLELQSASQKFEIKGVAILLIEDLVTKIFLHECLLLDLLNELVQNVKMLGIASHLIILYQLV